jgi:hypothetical protein
VVKISEDRCTDAADFLSLDINALDPTTLTRDLSSFSLEEATLHEAEIRIEALLAGSASTNL